MQSDKNIQALAARTLSKMDINEGRLKLRELAKNKDSQIRGIAIAYLGQIGDKDSKDTILEGLDDESGLVRVYSIYAIGYVGNSNDIPAIKKCFAETKEMNLSMGRELELLDGTVDDAIKQIESVK
jgi:HEAT repeat protein